MKKTFYFLAVMIMIIASCHHEPHRQPSDVKADFLAIDEVIDKMNASIKAADTTAFSSVMTDDALVLGSDPSEFLKKQDILNVLTSFTNGTGPEFTFITNREIKISEDGHSAIVVDQFISDMYTSNIPWRTVSWLIKSDNQWKIHFMSSSLIPKNEDLATLNNALNK